MLNGIYYLFTNAWNGLKTLHLPPDVSQLTETRTEIDQIKKELQQLKAENNRLKTVEHDYQKSIREQAQEISNLKTSVASFKGRLEESESSIAANKQRLEDSEVLIASYKRQLDENKQFLEVIGERLSDLKNSDGLDYSRTIEYIVRSAVR
ncbi:hypothetical protein K493DRAFT_317288, partial [Basidiobolus meristosporus CBS 931.73]